MTFKHTCSEPDGDAFGLYHCRCGMIEEPKEFHALGRTAPLKAEIKALKERLNEADKVIETVAESDVDCPDCVFEYLEKWGNK